MNKTTITITLSRAQAEKLYDVLASAQDEGPFIANGWKSPELEELAVLVEKAIY